METTRSYCGRLLESLSTVPGRRSCLGWISLVVALGLLAGLGCAAVPQAERSNDRGYLEGMEGVRLFYRVEGSGPDTVVVIHGGPGAGMDAVRPDFGPLAQNRTVIYYDQRGGGRSTLPSDTMQLGPDHHVGDLEAVRRFFGFRRMNIVAHSFGSLIAAEYALRHPDRLGRIVFLGATGPSRSSAAELARARFAQADSILLRKVFEPMAALLSGTAQDPVAACEAYHAAGAELTASLGRLPAAGRGSECLMEPEALRYYFRYTAQVSPRLFGDWDYTSSLDSLAAPLLVIHGDNDPRALEVQRKWAAAVSRGGILIVPDAGKGAYVQQPRMVFSAIDEFFGGGWPEETELVR